jgi:ferredoxin-NADP reductase
MFDSPAVGVISGATLIGLSALRAVSEISAWRARRRDAAQVHIDRQREFAGQLDAALRWARASHPKLKAWTGTRTFGVAAIIDETADCRSFYLKPQDGQPLPRFEPGQYLTFHLPVPGSDRPIVRCYSLSDRPREDAYRVTVKRVDAPRENPRLDPGRGSHFFHRELQPGSRLEVEAPQGGFFLDPTDRFPVVLVGAGIGITPLMSMASFMVHVGDLRPIAMFAGFRNSGEHPLRAELHRLVNRSDRMTVDISYSRPRPDDHLARDYDHRGQVTIRRIRDVLPSNNYRFYVCGPPSMMETLVPDLLEWGVPAEHIHYEAFGPATLRGLDADRPPSAPCEVLFARSGRTLAWTGNQESLLELAEQAAIPLPSGCRAGSCGQCRLTIAAGKVVHAKPPGVQLLPGECLACIATPQEDLVLDA